jgi:hypothetical protein
MTDPREASIRSMNLMKVMNVMNVMNMWKSATFMP